MSDSTVGVACGDDGPSPTDGPNPTGGDTTTTQHPTQPGPGDFVLQYLFWTYIIVNVLRWYAANNCCNQETNSTWK